MQVAVVDDPDTRDNVPDAGAPARQSPRLSRRPPLRLVLAAAATLWCVCGLGSIAYLSYQNAAVWASDAARERVDRGLQAVEKLLEERSRRLGDEAQALAQYQPLLEAFRSRDTQALNDLLAQARSFYGTTTAAIVVDERGQAVAEQPARSTPFDYSKLAVVRSALQPVQPATPPARRMIDARPTATNPLNDLGLTAAYPIMDGGRPAGAVVLLRAYNDALMDELAGATGLDVAVLTSDTLLAGSRNVRPLFLPPRIRPPGQRLAPVAPVHQLGDTTFIATSDPIRAPLAVPPVPTPAGGLPGAEPVPTKTPGAQGLPIFATLFVGLPQNALLDSALELRNRLLLAGGIASAAIVLLAWWVGSLVDRASARLADGMLALAHGQRSGTPAAGAFRETALLAAAFSELQETTTARLQALRDSLRKTEAIVDSVAEGIIVLDDRGQLVMINETAVRLLGLPGGLAPGANLQQVLTPDQWAALQPAMQRREHVTAEVHINEPKQAILRIAAVPVHDDDARPLGRAIVLQDVTEERLLDNVKADFFTAMSHELRTPLSAIKGAAELLLDDRLPTTQQHFLQTIYRNADRLSRLVTDLLDIGKLESGKVELHPARVDLNEVAADVVTALQPVAAREAQRLLLRTAEPSLTLVADHARLEQIITNLVSNALQYTQSGGEIVVSTWREGQTACLSVADNGAGISTIDQQHLFDKFYQGVNAHTRKRGGSGLGLTIVKHLVELHGGCVSVQSKLGEGSTFTVKLPLAPPVAGMVPAPSDSGAAGAAAGPLSPSAAAPVEVQNNDKEAAPARVA
jgi:PAS domain S-box-containing protein